LQIRHRQLEQGGRVSWHPAEPSVSSPQALRRDEKAASTPHWDDQSCIVQTQCTPLKSTGRVHEEVPFPRKPVEPVIRMLLPLKYRITISESSSPIIFDIFECASVVRVYRANVR
jgi:hypothetical protein